MIIKVGSLFGAVGLLSTAFTSASPSGEFRDSANKAFLKEVRLAVNSVRSRHHAPPVKLDAELTRYANQRIREIARGNVLEKGHQGLRRGTGELMYWSTSDRDPRPRDARRAVSVWYSEISEYDFKNPGFNSRTGHATQLLWRGSSRMGAAWMSRTWKGLHEMYIVVEFEKAGNIEGKFRSNVLPAYKSGKISRKNFMGIS